MSERREKFTPGPWVAVISAHKDDPDDAGEAVVVTQAYVDQVGLRNKDAGVWSVCKCGPGDDPASIADARFIAAAPELYDALAGLFESYKRLADSGDAGFWKLEDTDEGQQAYAALAKARGEA